MSFTATERLTFACVCGRLFPATVTTTLDLAADADIWERIQDGKFNRAACPECGRESAVQVPVLVLDPEKRKVALLLSDAHRHREMKERAALYERLSEWPDLPAFVRDVSVAYGLAGLAPLIGREVVDETVVEAVVADELSDRVRETPVFPTSAGPGATAVDAHGMVRLVARLDTTELRAYKSEPIPLIQLHRMSSYPLVTVGARPRGKGKGEPIFWLLDIKRSADRAMLERLGHKFQFAIDILVEGEQHATHLLEAPLEVNAKEALVRAQAALAGIRQPSFKDAAAAFMEPEYPKLGDRSHHLAEDRFDDLTSPGATRLALVVIAQWAEADQEEQLLLVHSFPVPAWRALRTRVMKAALEFGVRLPPVLAEFAVRDRLVPSRQELVRRLLGAFADVCSGKKTNDLDKAEQGVNWRGLFKDASAAGVPVSKRLKDLAEKSNRKDEITQPSAISAARGGLSDRDSDELVELLEKRSLRCDAALELCSRRESKYLEPLVVTVQKMTRGEVVRVMPALCAFGNDAVPYLCELLADRKSFLRHGATLGLGVLEREETADPLLEALLTEPTGVWKEMARVLGSFEESAVGPLASSVRNASAEVRERIAMALAHAAVGSGASLVERLAKSGEGRVAQVASRALDLLPRARKAQDEAQGSKKDDTVVSGFARRFYEAVGGGSELDIVEELDFPEPLSDSDIVEEAELEE